MLLFASDGTGNQGMVEALRIAIEEARSLIPDLALSHYAVSAAQVHGERTIEGAGVPEGAGEQAGEAIDGSHAPSGSVSAAMSREPERPHVARGAYAAFMAARSTGTHRHEQGHARGRPSMRETSLPPYPSLDLFSARHLPNRLPPFYEEATGQFAAEPSPDPDLSSAVTWPRRPRN